MHISNQPDSGYDFLNRIAVFTMTDITDKIEKAETTLQSAEQIRGN